MHNRQTLNYRGLFQFRRQKFATVNSLGWLLALIMGSIFVMPMAADVIWGIGLLLVLLRCPGTANNIRLIAHDPLFWCVAALLLYLAASVLWSPQAKLVSVTQVWLRTLYILCFFLALVAAIRELPGFESRVCRAVTLGALACALVASIRFYGEVPAEERLQGLLRFDNAGRVGHIFSVALPFILCTLLAGRACWRTIGVCALLSVGTAMLLTGTRTAWLSSAIGLLVYGLATRPGLQQRPLRWAAMFAVCCAISCILLAVWAISSADAPAILFPRGDSFRLEIWSAQLRDIATYHLWYGWGQLHDHWVVVDGMRFRGAHNMYLAVLGHLGISGLLLFCAVLVWTGMRLLVQLELSHARLGLSLLIAGCAVFIFSGDRLVDKVALVWFVLWFPIGIALAIGVRRQARG